MCFFRLTDAEPNYYFIGLSMKQSSLKNSSTEPKSLDYIATDTIYAKKCIECNISTTWQCQTCDAAYCRECFEKTHSEGKVMRKHIYTNSEVDSQKAVKFYCRHHEQLPFINFCSVCRIELCVMCTKSHDENHIIKSIKSMVSSRFD